MEEPALRTQICKIGRLMHQQGYIDGSSGNISARLGPDRILATPSGLAKGFITPDQLIVVNLGGERVAPIPPNSAHLQPTSELLMHLECYRQRPDVQGVIHAHPPTAVALTLAGVGFADCYVPEAIVLLGVIPTTPYAMPASAEGQAAIRDLIAEHDAIMLAYHGSLTVAADVWTAYMRLETLEHTARILHQARQLGAIQPLPAHEVQKLLAVRQKMGLARAGDAERFRHVYGVDSEGVL
jgi:L-fuculose-phosphate aldolase